MTIGQYALPTAWIAVFAAVLYTDLRMKGHDGKTIGDIHRVFWTYIITWKVSYIVFSFSSFVKAPLSALYFDGGYKGHLLALLVSVRILICKKSVVDVELLTKYWARLVTVSQLVTFAFEQQWWIVLVWSIVLIVIEMKWTLLVIAVQWGVLTWLHGFIDPYVFIQMIVLVLSIRKEKKLFAVSLVLTLVALTLTDIETNNKTISRQPIELKTMKNEQYHIQQQSQKVTVVNFFATWCPPCNAEMPHLQSFSQNIPDEVGMVGVNLTARDKGEKALQQFVEKYNVSYPILLDEQDIFGKGYEIASIPTTVIVDQNGVELQRIVGPVSESQLRNLIAILKMGEY